MPSKLKKAIGAVKDQTSISLAKVTSNNSSNLDVAVLKATTHDDIPIDDRYVYEVVHLVSSNKIYAAACARAIGKRIGRTRNWIVALKSLMLVLRIFQDGDPYFPREVLHAMKRGAKILNLSSFRDDSNSSPWDYTAFVRTFALYLDERLDCFLTGKLQRRYTNKDRERGGHRGGRRANEPVGDMKPAMLLDRIAFWQRLLERAIATRPTGAAKTNRLIQISLYAIVQESFDLYKDISDGLALLLDSFFHLQYTSCVNAFQTCVKAAKQFEELGSFYSLCKSLGVGRTSEYPCVQTISEELIETLQEFLKDQSSFPSVSKSAHRLALPAPASSSSGRQERYSSYGELSEFSEMSRYSEGVSEFSSRYSEGVSEFSSRYSEGVSEFGSQCTSLEDLISAADTGHRHGISIDLEAYSDQFEKKSQRDETLRMSDAVSTHSLPVSTSMADLVTLDEYWSEQEQETETEPDEKTKEEQPQPQSNPETSWELVLAEIAQPPSTQPEVNLSNTFNVFPEQKEQEQEQKGPETSSGWELVLAETAKQPIQQTPELACSLDSLYNQPATLPPNHYNPFLEELNELAIVPVVAAPAAGSTIAGFEAVFPANDFFSAAPTFQATPTFSAQNPDDGTVGLKNENDPFAALGSEQMCNGSMNQQNLLHEQQLWLQQQNKIIAKHMA